VTAHALRRGRTDSVDSFPKDVMELQGYFGPAQEGAPVRAVPGAGLSVPIWLLGSSVYGAQLAAALGLPFAFASHFAPDALADALRLYRMGFRPSKAQPRPYAMAAVAAFAAETDAEAAHLFTSLQQSFVNLRRGTPGPLPPPVDTMDGRWSTVEMAGVGQAFREAIVGSPATVKRGIRAFVRRTGIDELMVTAAIYDHAARLRSFEIIAEVAAGAD
jgi:luciferase family oxidoreductase group 1